MTPGQTENQTMTVENFLKQKSLDGISEQRKKFFSEAERHEVKLFNDKYWDLFSVIKNQWYYITTIKITT
jgi:hypothetical protein